MDSESSESKKAWYQTWYEKKYLVILASIFLFPVGMYGLWKSSQFRKWKELSVKGQAWRCIWVLMTFSLFISPFMPEEPINTSTQQNITEQKSAPTSTTNTAPLPGHGETITTDNFEVTLNGYRFAKNVETGNPFTDIAPQDGNRFITLNATFKNISDRSRMVSQGGAIVIDFNGKSLRYDHTEPILLEGWGLFLDQLNPLTSMTTRLVYKIPAEISGPVYWEPERGKRFSLGEI